jgi:hypothetical protein
LQTIFQTFDPAVFGAVVAAEHLVTRFEPVAHDAASAVGAFRREGVDGALEAVEGPFLPS